METVAPVMMACQLLPASPEKLASPTGMVNIVGFATAIRGQRKAFQLPMKLKMARMARAGVTRGRTTVKKIRNSPFPSTRAASMRSSGIVPMNWRIRKTPKALIMPGNMMPQ